MTAEVEKFVRFYQTDFGNKILEKEAEYIYSELKHYKNILDVGCGIGAFERKLKDLNITGLDNSAEMLDEARKINKRFVLGNAENLDFGNSTFDAVFYVTTLEFVSDYRKAIQEAWRVTKPNGKLLVMMLNPESEYFQKQLQGKGSYFNKIKHTNLREIKNYISKFYEITKDDYFLGIRGQQIFDTVDKKFASLYVIVGKKK